MSPLGTHNTVSRATCCLRATGCTAPGWCGRSIRNSVGDGGFKILNIYWVSVTCDMCLCCTNSRSDVEKVWLRRTERMGLPYRYASTFPAYLKLYHPQVTKCVCDSMKYTFRQLTLTLGPVLLFYIYLYRYVGRDSSVGIATRYGLDGPGIESRCGGGEIFRNRPDGPWDPPRPLYNGYRVFPGGKAAGAWCWPPTPPSSAEVMKVQGYTSTHPLGLSGVL